jgi:acyl-CoA hydrolase
MVNSFRRLVQPGDLNPGNRLFGGKLLAWIDEGAALYAMCQMRTKLVVTKKISEVLYDKPVFSGDVLEFWCETEHLGRTSLTVSCRVSRKNFQDSQDHSDVVTSCAIVFVAIDEEGRPRPFHTGGPPA